MTAYTVRAKRWRHGWELHIDGEGVTQARTLEAAEQTVRDYLATLHDVDEITDDVEIVPDIDLAARARAVREESRNAERARRDAARNVRDVALALRREGLSVTDTATILGVSRGRASQLLKDVN